jgi:hypothetical protein
MKFEFPNVNLVDVPYSTSRELLYWIHRTNELREPISDVYTKLFSYTDRNIEVIGFLLSILKRQLELTDSIFILAARARIKDVGVLMLNLYELTLDLQYVAINPGFEKTWLTHELESSKPWSIKKMQKALFQNEELESENNFFKTFSMIKHGNIAGKHISFDVYFLNDRLTISEATDTSLLPTLFAINYLLARIFKSAIQILSSQGIFIENLESTMKDLSGKYHDDFIALSELRVIELLHPENHNLQEKYLRKLDFLIRNGG